MLQSGAVSFVGKGCFAEELLRQENPVDNKQFLGRRRIVSVLLFLYDVDNEKERRSGRTHE